MRTVRVDDRAIAPIALVAGVAAALSDVSPTGGAVTDAVVLVAAVAAVTWASASAPWWALTTAAGVGAALALDGAVVVAVIGGLAALAGLWIGTQRRDLAELRAIVAGVALNVLSRIEVVGFTGATVIVGVGLSVLLLVTGLQRRKRAVRRKVIRAGLVVGAIAALAALVVGLAGLSARSDVSAGRQLVAEGIELLRDGEYADAAFVFDEAGDKFRAAERAVTRPWSQPARLVPVVAHNRRAVEQVATAAVDASRELANASLFIDPDDLRAEGGRFDLDEIESAEGPVTAAFESLVALREVIDEVESPWLLGAVERRLDGAAAEFDENVDQFDTAVQALQLLPAMLGGDEPRHYLVAFTTPAEARGLGGFMGNYAVLTADDGELSMSEFGRTADLNRTVTTDDGERRVSGPQDWLDRWGRFGFDNAEGGTAGDVPWSNITISPHFPSTAFVMSELFPQSGGRPVDGVFAMDPYVVEALVGFTGPLTVDGVEQRLTKRNTAQFLLFDQYLIEDTAERRDLLAAVSEAMFEQLLEGALPAPTVVADTLDPLADAGRLVGWAHDPDEQALFERVALTGALPQLGGADGVQVVVNNAAANKLDAWLGRSIRYRATFDPSTRAVVGRIELTLTNDGPTEGLPSGVIDNYVGDPIGTNRSLVTLYTGLPVTGATLDGQELLVEPGVEAGWFTASQYVVLPPGESRTIEFTVAGVIEDPSREPTTDVYELVIGTQPLVVPPAYDIEVTDPQGTVLVAATGRLPGVTRLAPNQDLAGEG